MMLWIFFLIEIIGVSLDDCGYCQYVNGLWSKKYRQDYSINESLILWHGSESEYSCFDKILEGSGKTYNCSNSADYLVEDSCEIDSLARKIWGEIPYILLFSVDTAECLLATPHYGTCANCMRAFAVGRVSKKQLKFNNHPYIVTKQQHFHTESGVHLGMTEEELIKLKGDTFQRMEDTITYLYIPIGFDDLRKGDNDEFLQYCIDNKVGTMYMKFLLKDGKVVSFVYGYEPI